MPRGGINSSNGGGGRIYLHEQEIENALILVETLDVDDSHKATVISTENHKVEDGTRKEHRRRMKHVYSFFLYQEMVSYSLVTSFLFPQSAL